MAEKGVSDIKQFARVGTTLYKMVRQPSINGEFIERRVVWNVETFRQDYGNDKLSEIPKYDGFCTVPNHITWYDKILNRITSCLQPKFFLLLTGIVLCFVSLALNIRFAERMQKLQDNDIKYRYLLMKGKADGNDINLLEINFNRERDNAFIQSLTDSVIDFEYRSRKQAEALERARLLDEQAKQLKEQAKNFKNYRE